MASLPTDHPTSLVFVDETGWTAQDRFFGVGALKLRDPVGIERRLAQYRREAGFDTRLRWASLGRASDAELAVASRALQLVCTDTNAEFACALIDRNTTDLVHGDVWQAYNRLAARAIGDVLDHEEIATVIVDRFDAPRSHSLEDPVRRTVNDRKGRLAVARLQQVASIAVPGVQLTDLLLGAITYQVRETHEPLKEPGLRMKLSLQVMQEHYGQTSYLKRGPGHLAMNRLQITVLTPGTRGRGTRGGRRRQGQ